MADRGGIAGLFGLISPRIRRVIGVVVLVAALGMIVGAVVGTISDNNLREHGVTTNATVIDTRVSTTRTGTGSRHITTHRQYEVAFTVNGKQYDQWLGNGPSLGYNAVVPVVYDPSDPSDVQLKSSLTGAWWIGPLVLVLFAGVFVWLGTKILRTTRWQRPDTGGAGGGDRDGDGFGEESATSGNLFQ
ncbi:MAG: DUF3592 domain-containing protein [Actinocrinis sp.]